MKKYIKKYNCGLFYSIVCTIIFLIIYLPIVYTDKIYMFIDIGADTYCSYYPSIIYVKNLISNISLWDNSLGLGTTTIIYICYFLIDPFNWISFLFSDKFIYIGIFIGLIFKNIALSIGSYLYIRKIGYSNEALIIAGLCITFSGWFIGWGQHYNFATMFVYFIWLLYFFERWIQNNKWCSFVFTFAWLVMLTPYFSYMIILFLIFYFIFRWLHIYKEHKISEFINKIFATAYIGILGMGVSAILCLPMLEEIFSSPRVSGNSMFGLKLPTIQESITIVTRFFSNNLLGNNSFFGNLNYYEAPFLYVGIIFLFIFPIVIINNYKNKLFKLGACLIIFSIIFVNFFGSIFNAFGLTTYRWTFLLIPVFSITIANGVNHLLKYKYNEKSLHILIYTFVFCFLGVSIYLNNKNLNYFDNVKFISFIFVIFIVLLYHFVFRYIDKRYLGVALIIITSIELALNGYVTVNMRNLIERESIETMDYFDKTKDLLNFVNERDNGFYRIYKTYATIDLNDSMIQQYSGEKLYSSTFSSEYWDLINAFDLRVPNSNYLYGFDDKQSLRNLISGKYIFTKEEIRYYEHNLIYENEGYYIYENNNANEFGVIYDSYITRSEFDRLSDLEKYLIVNEACIIDDEDIGYVSISEYNNKLNQELEIISFEMEMSEKGYRLMLENENNTPIYIQLNSVEGYVGETAIVRAFDINGNILYEFNNAFNFKEAQLHTECINYLGVKYIDIEIDINKINGINIYGGEVSSTKYTKVQNIEFERDIIKMNIESEENLLLFIPIIYDRNWVIKINGEETKWINANIAFNAINLTKGQNKIEIFYRNKSFNIGVVISLISILCVFITRISIYLKKKESAMR